MGHDLSNSKRCWLEVVASQSGRKDGRIVALASSRNSKSLRQNLSTSHTREACEALSLSCMLTAHAVYVPEGSFYPESRGQMPRQFPRHHRSNMTHAQSANSSNSLSCLHNEHPYPKHIKREKLSIKQKWLQLTLETRHSSSQGEETWEREKQHKPRDPGGEIKASWTPTK